MCRNIQRLRGADPPATEVEIRDAALQFVRKVSGYQAPSRVNEAAFQNAVEDIAAATSRLLSDLVVVPGARPARLVQRLPR